MQLSNIKQEYTRISNYERKTFNDDPFSNEEMSCFKNSATELFRQYVSLMRYGREMVKSRDVTPFFIEIHSQNNVHLHCERNHLTHAIII